MISFDEKQVFNNIFNDHSTNHGNNIAHIKNSFEKERQLYDAQIQL